MIDLVLKNVSKLSKFYDGDKQIHSSFESLFFPKLESTSISNLIAFFISHPLAWLSQLLCIFLFIVWMLQSGPLSSSQSQLVFFISLLASLFSLFFYTYFSSKIAGDYNDRSSNYIGLIIWGSFCAFASFSLNTFSSLLYFDQFSNSTSFGILASALVFAPVFEELLKGFGSCAFAFRKENNKVSGFKYGLVCGLGFAFLENWFYLSVRTTPMNIGLENWVWLLAYRLVFNSLAHAFFTGIFCFVISLTLNSPKKQGQPNTLQNVMAFFYAVTISIVLHVVFNMSSIVDATLKANHSIPFYLFNPTFMIMLVLTSYYYGKKSLNAESHPKKTEILTLMKNQVFSSPVKNQPKDYWITTKTSFLNIARFIVLPKRLTIEKCAYLLLGLVYLFMLLLLLFADFNPDNFVDLSILSLTSRYYENWNILSVLTFAILLTISFEIMFLRPKLLQEKKFSYNLLLLQLPQMIGLLGFGFGVYTQSLTCGLPFLILGFSDYLSLLFHLIHQT